MPDLQVRWETDAAALVGPIGSSARAMDQLIGRQALVLGQNRALAASFRAVTQAMGSGGGGGSAPGSGGSAAYYRAQSSQYRAWQQYYKLIGQQSGQNRPAPSFEKKLDTFIRSTRFGAGGASPLVGRTLDVLGLGKMGGVAMAAVSAIGLMAQAAIQGAQSLNRLAEMRWGTGASAGDAARMERVAAGLGVDPKELASGARGLAGSLASDPFAMMAGAKAGVSNPLGNTPLGNLNQMSDYLKMSRFIAMNPNEAEAVRAARATGMENILPLRDLDPQEREKRLNDAEGAASKDAIRRAARARAMMGDIGLAWERTKRAVFDAATLQGGGGLMPGSRGNGGPIGTDPEAERSRRAVEANTEALNAMATTMRGMRGGGDRSRGALPKGFSGAYAEQNGIWDGQARALGAFSQ